MNSLFVRAIIETSASICSKAGQKRNERVGTSRNATCMGRGPTNQESKQKQQQQQRRLHGGYTAAARWQQWRIENKNGAQVSVWICWKLIGVDSFICFQPNKFSHPSLPTARINKMCMRPLGRAGERSCLDYVFHSITIVVVLCVVSFYEICSAISNNADNDNNRSQASQPASIDGTCAGRQKRGKNEKRAYFIWFACVSLNVDL